MAGCLRDKTGGAPSRVCNSNDSDEVVEMGLCRPPKEEEMEIRMYAFDWDSSMFQTWILQILLSELLDVPVSVETGNKNIDFSFYSHQELGSRGSVEYTEFSSLSRALRFAYKYGDCRLAQQEISTKYEPCAHFSPEVRSPISNDFAIIEPEFQALGTDRDGIVELIAEPLEPAGGFGEQGLYIPKFTAERDPSLTSYFSLRGEENREKLAERFLRPTRWSEYCSEVSPTQCAEGDGVATRAPVDKMEEDRFFVPGVYNGHFRKTEKNDCEKNPLTCTGHVADYPCNLYTPLENQIFHLNLMLEGDGFRNQFGYGLGELPEIWHAANYTKSDVLLYWMQPTLLSQEYAGTDAEFTKVAFPPPSQDCIDARRVVNKEKCLQFRSDNFGDPEAVCDDPPFQLQKATSTSLQKLLIDGVPEDIQSPSYAVLKAYALPEMELSRFLEDLKGYDDPRLAVCDWVTNNMDTLQRFIPPTYPRIQQDLDLTVLLYISLSLGTIAALLVIWTGRQIYKHRKKSIIRFAQFEFLALVLVGSLLTAIGAIIGSFPRSDGICVAEIWLVYLGYTLALVPQIVKVAAINRLMSAARRYERLQLNLKHLYIAVTAVSLLVVVYLALWTALDSPLTQTHYKLTESVTASGETIVFTSYSCGSEMAFWKFVAFAWNGLLLVSSVVLAVQSRNVVKEFNESQTLGILIYTNLVFYMFRGLTYYLERVVDPSLILRYRSMIYALDVIGNLAVYFWPKLIVCNTKRPVTRRLSASMGGFSFDDGSGSSPFFASMRQARPMLTTMPTNGFVRLLTNVSNITFHPQGEESVTLPVKNETDGRAREFTNVEGESSDQSDADLSGDVDSKRDNDNTYVQKLEMHILLLETEVKDLRERIKGGQFQSVSSVGDDPPSPISPSAELDKADTSMPSSAQSTPSRTHGIAGSRRVPEIDHERLLYQSEKIPAPMPSSSSSEKVSSSDQESVASSSMPALTSYCSISESYTESEVSLAEEESFASPTVSRPTSQSEEVTGVASNDRTIDSGAESEPPSSKELSKKSASMTKKTPVGDASLSAQASLLKGSLLPNTSSIFSISELEENC